MTAKIRRRELITLLGGATVPWSLSARAQQPRPKQALLTWLTTGSKTASNRYFAGLDQGLEELGYRQGRDYQLVDRYADGDVGRLRQLAKELIQLHPDLILAGTTPATLAARAGTTTIPIVGVNMNDPVGMGLAGSEAHPGSNVNRDPCSR